LANLTGFCAPPHPAASNIKAAASRPYMTHLRRILPPLRVDDGE
jgi:hypothetical protein